jgi:guanylate kinase
MGEAGVNGCGAEERTGDTPPGRGMLVVISAPSGAGKTSVLRGVFERHPEARFSVSVTTRPPREGERTGVDYSFVDDREFDRLIAANEFIEWAWVHGNRYGTPRSTVEEGMRRGETVIFDTDTVGAANIRTLFPEAVLIFIAPPSPEILRQRLESRSTESPERIARRLEAAPHEMERAGDYDYIIINDTLEDAVAGFNAILEAERLRSKRMLPALAGWRSYLHGKGADDRKL